MEALIEIPVISFVCFLIGAFFLGSLCEKFWGR